MRIFAMLFCMVVSLAVLGCTHPNAPQADAGRGDSYGPAQPAPEYIDRLEHAIYVADHKYWAGDEGNRSVCFVAKFNGAKEMGTILDLNQDIMDFGGDHWVLSDIVVTMDFNGNGHVCSCILSGPKPVVDAYVDKVTALAKDENGPMYDFDVHPVDCLTSAAWGD